jgi:hydrogenase-4 component F
LGTRNIHRLGGAGRALPTLGALTLLGGLALGGSPPFSPFVSEFTTVRAAIQTNQTVAAVLLLLLLALAFGGILVHIGRVALGPASRRRVRPQSCPAAPALDRIGFLTLGLLAATVVLLGLHVPDGLVTLLRRAAAVIGGA